MEDDFFCVSCVVVYFKKSCYVIVVGDWKLYNGECTELAAPITLYPGGTAFKEGELEDLLANTFAKCQKTMDDITKIRLEDHSVNCRFVSKHEVEIKSSTSHAHCCKSGVKKIFINISKNGLIKKSHNV